MYIKVKWECGIRFVNPFSAIRYFRHPTIVNYFLSTEKVNLNFDILAEMQQWEVDWGKECLLMGECQAYEHPIHTDKPQILVSKEHLLLVGLNWWIYCSQIWDLITVKVWEIWCQYFQHLVIIPSVFPTCTYRVKLAHTPKG